MTKLYTEDGLWIEEIGDNVVRIGLSAYGTDSVGDVAYFDLTVEDKVEKNTPFFAVEGSKVVTEMLSPVSGQVITVNAALDKKPELLNSESADERWIADIMLTSALDTSAFLTADKSIEE